MDETSFLIIGANGQLGTALCERFPNAKAVDSSELDITSEAAVQNYDWSTISVIINAAAYTNVDGAETPEGRVAAWKINATGAANLARVAQERALKIVHISTDYVFDGTSEDHTEDEPFSPLGIYGQTKAAGDITLSLVPQHYVLRTTWVIGNGKNFVRTMINLGKKGVAPTVVADQIGRLTFTTEIVRAIDHLLTHSSAFGTYNVTNDGEPASWADVTREIFTFGCFDLSVTDTSTEEYFASKPTISPRPLNSIMSLSKLKATGFMPHDWRTDLADYVKKELEQ